MQPEKIKEIRKKRGMTQEQLAEKLGVKRSVVSKYESGSISPTTKMLENIAKALDVSTFELEDNLMAKVNNYLIENYSSVKGKISPIYMIDLMNKLSQPTQEHSETPLNKTDRNRMLSAFDIMNEDGQKKAADNVEDLAEVPKYQKEKDNAKP